VATFFEEGAKAELPRQWKLWTRRGETEAKAATTRPRLRRWRLRPEKYKYKKNKKD